MKEISKAILAVMADVEGVAKSMTVGTGSNSYKGVSDKDVRQKMRESMTKNGLSILPISVQPTVKMDRWEEVDTYSKTGAMKTKQSVFTEVVTKYLLLHTSGESVEIGGYGQGVDTQDKGAGKATTYALKNALLNMFLVPTGVDTDDTHSDDLPVPQRQYDQTEEEKPWMNDPEFEQLEANMHKFPDAESAIRAATQKYKVSKKMRSQIEDLYLDKE